MPCWPNKQRSSDLSQVAEISTPNGSYRETRLKSEKDKAVKKLRSENEKLKQEAEDTQNNMTVST